MNPVALSGLHSSRKRRYSRKTTPSKLCAIFPEKYQNLQMVMVSRMSNGSLLADNNMPAVQLNFSGCKSTDNLRIQLIFNLVNPLCQ